MTEARRDAELSRAINRDLASIFMTPVQTKTERTYRLKVEWQDADRENIDVEVTVPRVKVGGKFHEGRTRDAAWAATGTTAADRAMNARFASIREVH